MECKYCPGEYRNGYIYIQCTCLGVNNMFTSAPVNPVRPPAPFLSLDLRSFVFLHLCLRRSSSFRAWSTSSSENRRLVCMVGRILPQLAPPMQQNIYVLLLLVYTYIYVPMRNSVIYIMTGKNLLKLTYTICIIQ